MNYIYKRIRTKLSQFLCLVYMVLNNYIINAGFVIPTTCSIIGFYLFWRITHSYSQSALGLILSASACLSLYYLTKCLVYISPNTGVDEKFIFPGNHCKINSNGVPCEIIMTKVDYSRFEFATLKTADISAILNARAFSKTAWNGSLKEKYDRNLSHIMQNKFSFLLLKSLSGDYIGFTHIFPVTKRTWDKYMSGSIGDNNYSAKLIVSDQYKRGNVDPYGIIIFSVAAVGIHQDFIGSRTFKKDVGDYLEQAVVYHLKILMDNFFKDQDEVPVLFQNMGKEFLNFFEKAATSKKMISRDIQRIITFEVEVNKDPLSAKSQTA